MSYSRITTWYDGVSDLIGHCHTVNEEIFARILFSGKALTRIFEMTKIRDKGMIYLYQ